MGERIYTALKRDILDLTLEPGAFLDETRLSARFGMSRTPVREALLRLTAEGLVTTLPNRNTVVSTINFEQLPVYFDALTLMYRVTTRLAAARRSAKDLSAIRARADDFDAAVKSADPFAMIAANREVHVAIAEAGGNRYYTEMFTRLLDDGRRILALHYRALGDQMPRPAAREHAEMIAAIEARDLDRADRSATDHAAELVRQIQAFLTADQGATIDLNAVGRS